MKILKQKYNGIFLKELDEFRKIKLSEFFFNRSNEHLEKKLLKYYTSV